jgi:CheY-like chemotaxis protein
MTAEQTLTAVQAKKLAPGVLIVDDEPAVGGMLACLFRGRGLTPMLAGGGREAAELYRRHHDTIQAVLLDVRMPGLDGPQTLALLREIDPGVRCCFMSGDTGQYTPEGLLALGAARFFSKPFRNLDEVADALRAEAARGQAG